MFFFPQDRIATILILAAIFWCFLFVSPLTYHKPGLNVDQVNARQWLAYDVQLIKLCDAVGNMAL